jgi:hypothetical protein
MVFDLVAEEGYPAAQCWLYRCDDRSPFAHARGRDFIRNADHTLWAHLVEDQLVSVRSGEVLAYRVGSVFYDAVTREPLYYLPASLELPDCTGRASRSLFRVSP